MQTESIAKGALKLPAVLGIDIYNKETKEKIYSKYLGNLKIQNSDSFFYKIDLFHNTSNKQIYIGTIKYYSNSDVVFDRVKLGFIISYF